MDYSIGQVSRMTGLPVSTLRYYDKEGLFPGMERTSGIRRFTEGELERLHVIECLKRSGLEIRNIRRFRQWCAQGSTTYPSGRSFSCSRGDLRSVPPDVLRPVGCIHKIKPVHLPRFFTSSSMRRFQSALRGLAARTLHTASLMTS